MLIVIFTAPGCAACEAAIPEFEAWRAGHPTDMALLLSASGPYPERWGLKVKETPTYALVENSKVLAKYVGAMKSKQIERWVQGHMS